MTAREVSTGMWFTSFSFYSSRQLLSLFNFSIFFIFHFSHSGLHLLIFFLPFLFLCFFLSFSASHFIYSSSSDAFDFLPAWFLLLFLWFMVSLFLSFDFLTTFSLFSHFVVFCTLVVYFCLCHVAYFLWVHGVIVKVLKWLFYKFPYTVKLVPIMRLSITELVWLNVLTNTKTQFSFRSLVWIL